jgi:hypothetical protein
VAELVSTVRLANLDEAETRELLARPEVTDASRCLSGRRRPGDIPTS